MRTRKLWPGLIAFVLMSAVFDPAAAQRAPSARPAQAAPRAPPVREREVIQPRAERQAVRERRAQARRLDGTYAVGEHGWRYRRGEILIATMEEAVLYDAEALGMVVVARTSLETSGLLLVTYRARDDIDVRTVLTTLRARHPGAAVDLNYVYERSGVSPSPPDMLAPPDIGARSVGMVDIGVPQIGGARLFVQGAAGTDPAPSSHATAVAAILLNTLRSDAPTLFAADAGESGSPDYAAAGSIARGMDWVAGAGAPVINVSLAGPPNAALAAVTRALIARGVVIVAAVGNHGPHAPPAYPAAISEVVAVTAVDARGRISRRANQGAHVDFAAPGFSGRGSLSTSFACPVVAGLLARRLERADPGRSRLVVEALTAAANDFGPPGKDEVFGHGLVTASTW